MENFVFFWRTGDIASQWHPSPFVDAKGNKYQNCEQYMMAEKARLFGDEKTELEIMNSDDPKTIKALGRRVKNFDIKKWEQNREEIVYQGNLLKFQQNPEMMKWLLTTKGKTLVEASPYDSIWGIGYDKYNALKNQSKWGLNLLGKAIQKVRDSQPDIKWCENVGSKILKEATVEIPHLGIFESKQF
jgi:ribA/ribD-fused uncharacterized protein